MLADVAPDPKPADSFLMFGLVGVVVLVLVVAAVIVVFMVRRRR